MSQLPKYYSQVCVHKPADYSEYEHFQIKLGNPHRYQIGQQLGRGNYSDVFQGLDTAANKSVVIKLLKPVKMVKVKKEIKILQLLNGMNNTIKMLDVVKLANQKAPSLIFEHVNNACENDFRKFYASLDDQEVKYYMLELLKAVDYINSKGIMHRDIKPHNIVIDHQNKKLKLIDFGLADYYIPKQEYNVRVASRYFKAPELLLENPLYDYSVDIWSIGCLFAGIIFMKEPFFAGEDNLDQLVKITKVVGSDQIENYMKKYDLELNDGIELPSNGKQSLSSFINDKNRNRISDEALDLLDRMLQVDHTNRITAKDAMKHPYFQPKMRQKQLVPKLSFQQVNYNQVSKQTYMNKQSTSFKQFVVDQRHQSPQPWAQPPADFNMSNSPRKRKYQMPSFSTADRQCDSKSMTDFKQMDDQNINLDINSKTEEASDAIDQPKSNINVVVRVRPILQREKELNDMCIVTTTDNNIVQIMDPKDFTVQQGQEYLSKLNQPEISQHCYYRTSMNNNRKQSAISTLSGTSYERNYSYDKVFGQNCSNREIYDYAVKGLTNVVLSGYNATIFAYGVTGAGKTHTMIGYQDEPGLMFYTVNHMFEGISANSSKKKAGLPINSNTKVEVSFLEIYNEQIRDLIMPQQQALELREDPSQGVQINGLSVFEVKQRDQIFDILAQGNANRTQESTRQNQTSSRSHAVLIITYKKLSDNLSGSETTIEKTGKLSLIDLAGSERASKTGNTGQRMKEGACINKSLLALGNCINILYENSRSGGLQKHVPFRDSKLTRILKESLIGNSKTLMIANISPSSQNYEDTLNTLKYANRTKDLKTKITKNTIQTGNNLGLNNNQELIDQKNKHINDLQNEIEILKAELAQQKKQQLQQPTPTAVESEQSQLIDQSAEDQDQCSLFSQVKTRIIDQFNEEQYYQAQLKGLYIDYENLLFQQKMLKIELFIQENQSMMHFQPDFQRQHIIQTQLLQLIENEQLITSRIEHVREEQKNLIRKRNQLKEYIQDQFKDVKRRDYYGQKTQRGSGLTKIQIEILETLFQSNEQQLQNTAMQVKEQRLNIKMAKKEYMISCMAQQVDLREFCPQNNVINRQNFLSKQQIDEILRDTDIASCGRSFRTVPTIPDLAADSTMHKRQEAFFYNTQNSFSVNQVQQPLDLNEVNYDEFAMNLKHDIHHSQNLIIGNCNTHNNDNVNNQLLSKPVSRQRSRGSPSVEEFARNVHPGHSRNKTASPTQQTNNNCFPKTNDGLTSEITIENFMNSNNPLSNQNTVNLNNQTSDVQEQALDTLNGIKLYQPLQKKSIKITNVIVRPSTEDVTAGMVQKTSDPQENAKITHSNETRSLSDQQQPGFKENNARENPGAGAAVRASDNGQQPQRRVASNQKKSRELSDLQRQMILKHPANIYMTTTTSNNQSMVENKKDACVVLNALSKNHNKKESQNRNSFNHHKVAMTSRGNSISKQSANSTNTASVPERSSNSKTKNVKSQLIYGQLVSQMNSQSSKKQRSSKPQSISKRKKDLDDDQPCLSDTENQHYFKTHKTTKRYQNIKQKRDSNLEQLSSQKQSPLHQKVQSELFLNQGGLEGQGWFPGGSEYQENKQRKTFVSDMAKKSPNRKHLYRNARNSSKQLKEQMRQVSQSPELMEDIQVVIDDVNHRISEYEQYKSSFADQDATNATSVPNQQYPFQSTKSAMLDCRASSSEKDSTTFNSHKQFQSMNFHKKSPQGSDQAQIGQSSQNVYFTKGSAIKNQSRARHLSMALQKRRSKHNSPNQKQIRSKYS